MFASEFSNRGNQTVSVRIVPKNPIGGVPDKPLTLAGSDPLSIRYETENENDPFTPLLYGSATLKVLIDGSSNLSDFVTAMSSAADGAYNMIVKVGVETVFYGIITPDDYIRSIHTQMGAEMEVKAVCPITFTKGQKLTMTDGKQFRGKHTIKDYVTAILANAFNISPTPSVANFTTLFVHVLSIAKNTITDNSLPYPNDTYFPPFWEQVKLNAIVFNDSDGRPMNAHDVLVMILKALRMRMTFDNWTFRLLSLDGIHNHPTASGYTLIGNAELINRSRRFREVRVEYKYNMFSGTMLNGAFIDWEANDTPSDTKVLVQQITNNDYSPRRRGNGRTENPYGFMLRYGYRTDPINSGAYSPFYQIDKVNMLAFRTEEESLQKGQSIKVEVSAYTENYRGGGFRYDGDDSTYTRMICDAFIYNSADPTQSYRSKAGYGGNEWELIDLSGTAFSTTNYDFTVNTRNRDMFSNRHGIFGVDAYQPNYVSKFATMYAAEFGTPLTFRAMVDIKQTSSIDLPPAPVSGTLFIAVSPILNVNKVMYSFYREMEDYGDTVITGINVAIGSADKINKEKTSSVTYRTREITAAIDTRREEIAIDTSTDSALASSLWTDIVYKKSETYTLPGVGTITVTTVTQPGFIPSVVSPGGSFNGALSLSAFNAHVLQQYNENRFEFKFKAVMSTVRSFNGYKFPILSGIGLPAGIDEWYFMPTRIEWSVRSGIADITAISMRKNYKDYSRTTLSNTLDLLEEYR